MTLKENILRLSNKENDVSDFLKAYLRDKTVFGEDTADIYASVYSELMGEDYTELFESIEENFNILKEGEIEDALGIKKAIADPTLGLLKDGANGENSIKKATKVWMAQMKNPGLFAKIGKFFSGLKDSFVGSKAFSALKNGLGWIINPANLPIVISSAAGIGVVTAIISALKKKGKKKEADSLALSLKNARENR